MLFKYPINRSITKPVELLVFASGVAAAEVHDVVIAAERLEVARVARTVLVARDAQVGHGVNAFL